MFYATNSSSALAAVLAAQSLAADALQLGREGNHDDSRYVREWRLQAAGGCCQIRGLQTPDSLIAKGSEGVRFFFENPETHSRIHKRPKTHQERAMNQFGRRQWNGPCRR